MASRAEAALYEPAENADARRGMGASQLSAERAAGRVRAGFVPAIRREVFAKIKPLKISKFPFANLPETEPGRWGQGLTAEKMKLWTWVKPQVVVRIDFAEWTGADKLRHTKYIALRDDKGPRKVVRET
jgi:ATP-dependent DNA ligase